MSEVTLLSLASIITAGTRFTCALASERVYCWGDNALGQLGRTGSGSRTPIEVSGITRAADVSAGSAHACVLLLAGEVLCWGANDRGQLGIDRTSEQETPQVVRF